MLRRTGIAVAVLATTAGLSAPALAAKPVSAGHETVTHGMMVRNAHAAKGGGHTTKSNLLTYHGGAVGLTPRVVIVYFGSQWDPAHTGTVTNDPAVAVPVQLSFFHNITTNSWVDSNKQYCTGTGPTSVGASAGGTSCTNHSGDYPADLVAATVVDNGSAAPSRPTQTDLANEAAKIAKNMGYPLDVQYIIDTASHNNTSGFGTQFCAWHSSTTSEGHQIAYTNMPYVADAGSSCGAGFIKSGTSEFQATEGVTIVGGHEWAETVTDEYPNGGWLDGSGAENGDKCAWISSGTGASRVITTSNGQQFAIQTLWSNADNGCVAGAGN